MKTSLWLVLSLFISAASARAHDLPRIDFPDVELTVPELKLTFSFAEPATPRQPKVTIMYLCPGSIVPVPAWRPSADPLPDLCRAFRTAKSIETWTLQRAVDPRWYPENFWGKFTHHHVVIAGVRRSEDSELMTATFLLTAKTMPIDRADDPEADVSFEDEPTIFRNLDSTIELLGFRPEFVITFIGRDPVRVEFDPQTRQALLESRHGWSFYHLDRAALDHVATLTMLTTASHAADTEPTLIALATGDIRPNAN